MTIAKDIQAALRRTQDQASFANFAQKEITKLLPSVPPLLAATANLQVSRVQAFVAKVQALLDNQKTLALAPLKRGEGAARVEEMDKNAEEARNLAKKAEEARQAVLSYTTIVQDTILLRSKEKLTLLHSNAGFSIEVVVRWYNPHRKIRKADERLLEIEQPFFENLEWTEWEKYTSSKSYPRRRRAHHYVLPSALLAPEQIPDTHSLTAIPTSLCSYARKGMGQTLAKARVFLRGNEHLQENHLPLPSSSLPLPLLPALPTRSDRAHKLALTRAKKAHVQAQAQSLAVLEEALFA